MPQNIREIEIGPGVKARAVLVDVLSQDEKWNTYLLEDGTSVRLKAVAYRIWRLVDVHTPDGSAGYFIQTTNIVVADGPQRQEA